MNNNKILRFSTLWAALGAANLSEVASSEGPFTMFAPTNDAFAKVSNHYDDRDGKYDCVKLSPYSPQLTML